MEIASQTAPRYANLPVRTRIQEMRYNQALGYAWGQQDATHFTPAVDSYAFGIWYAMNDFGNGPHQDVYSAFQTFTKFTVGGQRLLARPFESYSYIG